MTSNKTVSLLLTFRKRALVVFKGLPYLLSSKRGYCDCCSRPTVFLRFGPNEERLVCLRCRANLRYRLLARHLRALTLPHQHAVVVEFDPNSPLRKILAPYSHYTRTYYDAEAPPGTPRPDGAICQDLTKLTFPDQSVDLMVSSEVLEHVPDLRDVFAEISRVLKPGGFHIFTVPTRSRTEPRVLLSPSGLTYVKDPEYHSDPLNPQGILTWWDIGPDLPSYLGNEQLQFATSGEPIGLDRRFVWICQKRLAT